MALESVVGFTEDGLVFLQFQGQQSQDGRPIKTIITMERDHAEALSKNIHKAVKKAQNVSGRAILIGGNDITIKKG